MAENKIELNDGLLVEMRLTGNNLKDEMRIKEHCVLQKEKIIRHKPKVQKLEIAFLKLKETELEKGKHLVEALSDVNELKV